MTKIDIISGFLGAGKTTFIKKLLEEAIAGEKVVLIENEFGEIGIDGGFLRDSGIEIREMNSGCICCSLVGDFGASLSEVLAKYAPDRVIIEPSGVGKLSDVMKAVRDVASRIPVTLNSAVTVVDSGKCRMYMKNFGEFFNNQIENAGAIVLSRTDLTPPDKIKKSVELIKEHNSEAIIITTPLSRLSGRQLLELIEKPDDMAEELLEEAKKHFHENREGCRHGHEKGCGHAHRHGHEEECGHAHRHGHGEECGHDHRHGHEEECGHAHRHGEGCGHAHHHDESCGCGCGHDHSHDHHHADEVFTSWGMENILSCSREKLEAILDELAYGDKYGEVLRAKGMIPSSQDGRWIYFDLVPEEFEIRDGKPDYTGKVCVIGANLNEEALKSAFLDE